MRLPHEATDDVVADADRRRERPGRRRAASRCGVPSSVENTRSLALPVPTITVSLTMVGTELSDEPRFRRHASANLHALFMRNASRPER